MGIIALKPYFLIKGKWNKNHYEIIKKIGQGGIGVVYLAKDLRKKEYCALKISKDNSSLHREYETLRKLENVKIIIPAYEIDDIEIEGEVFYYICLKYIMGSNLQDYFNKKEVSLEIIIGLILVLIEELNKIYSLGYIIGDLKLDNIMLDLKTKAICLVDLGSVVKNDDVINEFTPAYDRASWGCGERRAEQSYNIFAISMIIIRLILKEEFNPRKHNINDIIKKVNESYISHELKELLIKGLIYKEDLNSFTKELKKIYNSEKLKKRQVKLSKLDFRVNTVFAGSIIFMLSTIVYIILKAS